MKYINTHDLKEPIDWNRKISSNKSLTKKVKSIGLKVKEFGDDGIKQINQELKIKSPKSFLVKNQENVGRIGNWNICSEERCFFLFTVRENLFQDNATLLFTDDSFLFKKLLRLFIFRNIIVKVGLSLLVVVVILDWIFKVKSFTYTLT